MTLSPPVSPSVVARILMIQKPSVTAGTLLSMRASSSQAILFWPWPCARYSSDRISSSRLTVRSNSKRPSPFS